VAATDWKIKEKLIRLDSKMKNDFFFKPLSKMAC
jgi:hypothetical protein